MQDILLVRTDKDDTVQHTATRCNTLQHTATHYNTLQHTATRCNTLQHKSPLTIPSLSLTSPSPALAHHEGVNMQDTLLARTDKDCSPAACNQLCMPTVGAAPDPRIAIPTSVLYTCLHRPHYAFSLFLSLSLSLSHCVSLSPTHTHVHTHTHIRTHIHAHTQFFS